VISLYPGLLQIGQDLSFGFVVGMAYIVADGSFFAT
jgi:hypothetical protein